MSDRQERRRQLTRAPRVENWRACQDARGAVARILYVADRPLVGIARRLFSEGEVLHYSLGCMNLRCVHCGAVHFVCERVGGTANAPTFSTCCGNGRLLDVLQQLPDLPDELEELVSGNDKRSRQFRLDVFWLIRHAEHQNDGEQVTQLTTALNVGSF